MPLVYFLLVTDGRIAAAFYLGLLHFLVRAATRGSAAYRKRLWRRAGLILCLVALWFLPCCP